MSGRMLKSLCTVALAILAATGVSAKEDSAKVLTALQDRIAIEDLLIEYYSLLGSGSHKGFDRFFTPDAVLDINGIILKGYAEIQGIYDSTSGTKPTETVPPEKMHMDYMHLTNPMIRVTGETATAEMFWTGVVSDDANEPPKFEEMGREYDLLVKQNGKWLIKKRVIVADAGLPRSMNGTYKRYKNYDILKAQ